MPNNDILEQKWQDWRRDEVLEYFPKRIQSDINTYDPDVSAYVDIIHTGKSLYFQGKAGTAKTITAAAVMLECAHRNWFEQSMFAFQFVPVPELLYRLRQTIGSKVLTESDIIEKVRHTQCLILDDVGAEKTSDWTLQSLYLIVDFRYREMIPTIFTSNYTLDELAERLRDDRLCSRISGMSKIVKFDGKDLRNE